MSMDRNKAAKAINSMRKASPRWPAGSKWIKVHMLGEAESTARRVEGRERINLSLILSGTVLILLQLGFSYLFLFSSGQENKIHRKDGKRRARAEAECSLWKSGEEPPLIFTPMGYRVYPMYSNKKTQSPLMARVPAALLHTEKFLCLRCVGSGDLEGTSTA